VSDFTGSIIFLSDEALIPANRGGRVETANEVAALVAAGWRVQLVVPFDSAEEMATGVSEHQEKFGVEQVVGYVRPGKIYANAVRPWLPHIASSRVPSWRDMKRLISELSDFGRPDALLCAHDYMLPVARRVSSRLNIPIVVRSHNNEFRALLASGLGSLSIRRKAFLIADAWRYRFVASFLVAKATDVLLLSVDDRSGYRRARARLSVVGPILASTRNPSSRVVSRGRDCVFVGALDTPQTRHGLDWFISEVAPILAERAPGVIVRIVGRNAPQELVSRIDVTSNIQYVGEVDDIYEEILSAGVFINPVFLGSGVNMKMGPPAELGLPIVTTSFGLRGLESLRGASLAADDPFAFAMSCKRLLEDRDLWQQLSAAGPEVIAGEYSAEAFASHLRLVVERIRAS
tara:strand:+ start:5092 stop:6303 length:1212 start_codon:yes stop_codon:yes gene_type:complete